MAAKTKLFFLKNNIAYWLNFIFTLSISFLNVFSSFVVYIDSQKKKKRFVCFTVFYVKVEITYYIYTIISKYYYCKY